MEVPAFFKKPPVLIGAVILIIVILVIAKKGSASSGTTDYAGQLAAVNANNQAIAQINADVANKSVQAQVDSLGLSIGGQVNLAGISAQKDVALAKIASDTSVQLQVADYGYTLSNQQLENNRILGLAGEDTKRLINTQDDQTKLTLGITGLDTQRAIAERAYNSQDYANLLGFQLGTTKIASDERVQDFTSSRALTYATISGANQVAAIKAAKPSAWTSFLGSLGKGLGGGLSTFLGGL